MKLYSKTDVEISNLHADFMKGQLYVDRTYQRRKVWNDEDKVRFIETILMNYVVPEVFFWKADRDLKTGIASTHIVDGQQRITTIVDYINGEFPLASKYLMNDVIKKECGDKCFEDLPDNYKDIMWGYEISVINIDKSCTFEQIKNMFYRLNLTEYNLNSQEKRKSKDSAFGDKCEALSTLDFWNKVRVFSANDAKRMYDVVFCCGIYILANEFIINQTDDSKVNDYYDDYAEEFDSNNLLFSRISSAMEIIEKLVDKNTKSFISKKTQLYTIFSVLLKMIEDSEGIEERYYTNFRQFVKIYSKFRNGYEVSFDDPKTRNVYEDIKGYKLASSEGVNKIANRMYRYEILYKYFTLAEDISENIAEIENAFDEQHKVRKDDSLEADDIE